MSVRATPAGAAPIRPADVEAAVERTSGYVRSTPVVEVEAGALASSGSIMVKLEQLQHTGSFKPRGAFNRMLAQPVPRAGVVAASGGNFGAAVAYAASMLGHVAELFVPESTTAAKVDRLHAFGGSSSSAARSTPRRWWRPNSDAVRRARSGCTRSTSTR